MAMAFSPKTIDPVSGAIVIGTEHERYPLRVSPYNKILLSYSTDNPSVL